MKEKQREREGKRGKGKFGGHTLQLCLPTVLISDSISVEPEWVRIHYHGAHGRMWKGKRKESEMAKKSKMR